MMNSEVLNSWKEIAAYLGRGVRTVQRWEQELGLPVRRPRGKDRSAVVALKTELDGWVRRSPNQVSEHAAEFKKRYLLFSKNVSVLRENSGRLAAHSRLLAERVERAIKLTTELCGDSNGQKKLVRVSRTDFIIDRAERKTNGNCQQVHPDILPDSES